ncbi:hypothetical protein CVU82_03570 [Candidatus Falkowbacteria bacterium HGW-Falkowbacteria-1]|jgi:hypothetical protein|uniref:Uncharacterized protein n=1 Tax=Candidatus Falkowbacteria bacterium HGW-Falkowbacteria-1 TaxID=2013768 RepID=A0A2N2E8Q9_9BACT|nr:MAG: hypothetical protein CVU82_03570 [Candidatus Falkowbacteria bacterium HGW-Falkowbacteria-1]
MIFNIFGKIKIDYLYQFFYFLSKILLVSFLLEVLFPGIIITYFNLNILLIIWLFLTIFIIFSGSNKEN